MSVDAATTMNCPTATRGGAGFSGLFGLSQTPARSASSSQPPVRQRSHAPIGPTIDELLAAVPDLQKMDWINLFGPARAWESVASDIQTDALEWLTKALVIAEREFDWIGGSVAAPIWLYQAHSTRVGADADALANWVLRNRGRNEYIPFGRSTSARSVEEWREEEKGRQSHREWLRLMEEQKKKEKAERKQRAIERVTQRKHESRERHAHIER